MPKEIYKRLAEHLDGLPGGFPPTETGVEIRILKHLFTPEEAELALHVNLIPETANVVARRAGLSAEEAEGRLEAMAAKGQVFNMKKEGFPTLYMAAQYVIGIWEYHVNDLTPELIKDMNEYIPTLMDVKAWKEAPQLRTIPVDRSISHPLEVLSHEKAEELIRAQKKMVVAPCICRREHRMVGEGCDKPEESCLIFGMGADYYERNGIGRRIDQEEALEIVRRADKAGLVLQPSNAEKIINICCCCGCCCQVLKTVKRHPKPADLVSSAFIARADARNCKGCGVCAERCQMDALSLQDESVVLDPDRCIGCGLCVSTCPTGSLSLVRKPGEGQPRIHKNMLQQGIAMGKARGKLGPVTMAKMQLKSKLDRLLAPK